ncbi:hypothetical protein EON82_22120, partial [bacterium]
MSLPTYRYATNADGDLVDVLELTNGSPKAQGPFRCVGCEAPLVAKLKGERREKHFAHKADLGCGPETYLHRLGKKAFCDAYRRCLAEGRPFLVERTHTVECSRFESLLGRSCDAGSVTLTHDLTRYYDDIRMEVRSGEFVPDLLLSSSRNPERRVYVEIAVTHFLSERKESSGEGMIEIPLESEADIAPILACRLGEEHAAFLNLGQKPVRATDSQCRCAGKDSLCFLVYRSGKCYLEEGSLQHVLAKVRRVEASLLHRRLLTPSDIGPYESPSDVFRRLLAEAADAGLPVRNCFLCRYAGVNWSFDSDGGVFCKAKKVTCGSNAA